MEGCFDFVLLLLGIAIVLMSFGAWVEKRNEVAAHCQDVKQKRSAIISALHRKVDLINRILQVALHYEKYETERIDAALAGHAKLTHMSALVANLTGIYPTLRANEPYQDLMKHASATSQVGKP